MVEGTDDVSFVKRVFEENVVCYESFSGKEGLHQLIECAVFSICSTKLIIIYEFAAPVDRVRRYSRNRIIGICDKDYALKREFPPRMFCYDTCCMEIMLLSHKEVARRLYTAYYKGSVS